MERMQDNPDIFFGNQDHLANALERDAIAEANRQDVARDFIRNTNAARRQAEAAAAAAAAKKQGKGGISKKGGQRKTLKKTKLKSKLRSKSKRKSNKYKVQKKTSQRRRHI
jgi:hypothetical protein